ncbi:MAG: flippase, partial [Patescibacteria group bacterium]
LSSSIVQKLLTLAYFIVVARVFGPEEQGRYSVAIAFATLFSVFIDLGLSSALTRETARDETRAKEYLGQMFLARITLGVLVYGMIVGSAMLLGYSHELVSMIMIAGIASVIDPVTSSCWFMIRGFRNLLYESIGSIAAIVGMMIIGIGAVILHLPVIALVYAVLFGSCVNLVISLVTVFVRARIPLIIRPNMQTLRYLALISLPFAGAAIFSRGITFSDVTILTKIAGEQAVGWYTAGNKLVLALNVIPGSIAASLYPALSSYFVSAPEKLSQLTAKAFFFLLLVSVPLGLGIAITSPVIVSLFYGADYLPTVPILTFLGFSLIFSFLAFPFGSLLAAANRQKTNTLVFGVAALVNVVGNYILISWYGALGASITSLLTTAVLMILSGWFVRHTLVSHARILVWQGFRIIASGCIMALVLTALVARGVPLGILIFTGVCVYVACILLTRTITIKELLEVRDSFLRAR